MSDSVQLSELDGVQVDAEGVRRDRWGGYLCRPPGSAKLVAHRRVSTVLKTLDSEGGLVTWAQGRALLGAVRDKALLAKLRRLVAAYGDPWYDGAKGEYKALIAELAKAGGDKHSAELGTSRHAVAERWLLEGEVPDDPAARAWLDGYLDNLARAGVVIDPAYLETIVVLDGERIAGKVDYLRVGVPGYPLPMIGDLKTGDSLEYSLSGYVIQLATYRSADAIYVQGADPNGSDDMRLEMPELDDEHALIIHAPANGTEMTLLVVDLAAGRHGLATALAVEAWRKRADLATELDDGRLSEALSASLAAVPPKSVSVIDRTPQPRAATNGAELRAWLQARINAIGRHDGARSTLARRWPADLPTLKAYDAHTDEQLTAIERVCDSVEALHSLPFGTPRPDAEQAALRWITSAFPGSTVVAEPPQTTDQGARAS